MRTMRKKGSHQQTLIESPTWGVGANEQQRAVIDHDTGPASVLAYAGSGKTFCMANRIARLVSNGVHPTRILATTFTKKGGDEIATRIRRLDVDGVRVGTLHSFCLQILKETRYRTWEIRDQTKMEMKDVIGFKGMKWDGADVNRLMSFVGLCKANLIEPGDDDANQFAVKLQLPPLRAREAYQRYQDVLVGKAILSLDDYVPYAVRHLEDEDNRRMWACRHDHVIHDEAQDENKAQHVLLGMLCADHRNYMVIGDCFQSIYSWRGSNPQFLARFADEWPDAKRYVLGKNYRSGSSIINAANGIVAKAKIDGIDAGDTMMVPHRPEPGKVTVMPCTDADDEAYSFAQWVKLALANKSARAQDHCALFRTNAQSRGLEAALLKERIPYVVVGGIAFYQRKEVKDLLAYLRVAANRDDREDVKRCINAPFRFLGAAFVDRLMNAGAPTGNDWPAIVRDVAAGQGIQNRQRYSADEWASIILGIETSMKKGSAKNASETDVKWARPAALLDDIIRRTQYITWLQKEEGEDSIETSPAANVRELCRVAEQFATVNQLLDYIEEMNRAANKQRADKQAGGNRVLLMNVYRAKGLEWKRVWIAGFNELLMPHPRGDAEEERRVAYVASTRARDEMVYSFVRSMATRDGIRDAYPSRFLRDTGVSPEGDAPPSVEPYTVDDEDVYTESVET